MLLFFVSISNIFYIFFGYLLAGKSKVLQLESAAVTNLIELDGIYESSE
jgi:hypothetical protein